RRNVRRDIESTGNGYMEFIRNASDELVFCRYADSTLTRLMELDKPVVTEKVVRRKGAEVKMRVVMRERRFAQISGANKLVYFKEFGSERDLNKHTGEWAPKGTRLPYKDRASEMMHFKA